MNGIRELPRKLGLLDGTAILIGTVIGSGIFLTPSFIARSVRYPGLVILVWIVAGMLSLCGALTYAELGTLRPNAGGQYVFLRDAFGRPTSFLYGWSAFWVIHTGTLAAVSVAFALYLRQFFPLSPFAMRVVPVAFITFLTALNCVGVEVSKWYQNVMTFLKLGAIGLLIAASVVLSHPTRDQLHPFLPAQFSAGMLGMFGMAMMGALFAYEGWSFLTYTAGEIRNPRRNLPIALIVGTTGLILIYGLMNFSYMLNLTPTQMAVSDRVAAASAERLFGSAGGSLVAGVILLCILGATNGVVLTGPRIYYAMSRDGLFFKRLAEIHPRYETPTNAIIAQGVWASILAFSGTYERLFTFGLLGAWVFYAITASTIFVYRHRSRSEPEGYRTWGYPVVPGAFIVVAVFLVGNTIVHSPRDSLLCLGFVASGLPAYWYWRNRKQDFGVAQGIVPAQETNHAAAATGAGPVA